MSRSQRTAGTRRTAGDPRAAHHAPTPTRPGRVPPRPTWRPVSRPRPRPRPWVRALCRSTVNPGIPPITQPPAPAAPPRPDLPSTGRRRWRRVAGLAAVLLLVSVTSTSSGHAVARAAENVQTLALAGTFTDVLNNIRGWLLGILATLATVFLTVGGVRYVLAGGDPSEVEKAKTCLKTAAIGYGLAALAPLVTAALQQIVGGP